MRLYRLFIALVVLALLSPLARAEPASMAPDAKRHLELGLRNYNLQNYDAAIAEFKAGYQIDPQPAFLFAIAQAERLQGSCARAIPSYQAFLRSKPSSRQAQSAAEMVARCRETLKARTAAAAATKKPAPVAASAPPVVGAAHEQLRPRYVWYKDWIGDTLVAAGVAGLVAGGVVYADGRSAISRANGATTYDAYSQAAAGASARQTGGVVAMAAGGALLVAGVLDFTLRARADHRRRTHLAASFIPGGALVVATRRF